MKKYLIFLGDVYYPCRGIYDFKTSVDSRKEADKYLKAIKKEFLVWWQIVDRDTFEILEKGET